MLYRTEFEAMGCLVIAMLDSSSPKASEILSEVSIWFDGWEQTLSRFKTDSELTKLNMQAGWPYSVSQVTWDVFQAAAAAEKASGGLVKATILKALISTGYDKSFKNLINEEPGQNLNTWNIAQSLDEVTLDKQAMTICLPLDVQLDFGGVAKGWAADQAAKRLAEFGPALVSAGGDMAVTSLLKSGETWPVTIDDPFNRGEVIANLGLTACGMATSGTDYRRWKAGGQWNHHIIDPRTGRSAQTDIISATVVAPNIMEAEMAAKTVVISGSQQGLKWIEDRPGYAAFLVLESSGEIIISNQMNQYFWRSK